MSDETGLPSECSRGLALALCGVGGVFGLHRFYAGRRESAIGMCVSMGGLGVWWLYDLIVLLGGDFRDGAGRRIVRWQFAGVGGPPSLRDPRIEALEERLLGLESQVGEVAERLDFAERMLAQHRDKDRLRGA